MTDHKYDIPVVPNNATVSTKRTSNKKKPITTDPVVCRSVVMPQSLLNRLLALSSLDYPDEEMNVSRYVRVALTQYLDVRGEHKASGNVNKRTV